MYLNLLLFLTASFEVFPLLKVFIFIFFTFVSKQHLDDHIFLPVLYTVGLFESEKQLTGSGSFDMSPERRPKATKLKHFANNRTKAKVKETYTSAKVNAMYAKVHKSPRSSPQLNLTSANFRPDNKPIIIFSAKIGTITV